MRRLLTRIILFAALLSGHPALIRAQTPTASTDTDHFEVASVKPSNPTVPPRGRLVSVQIATPPGRLIVANVTLKELITGAYGVSKYQVSRGPSWVDSTRFDVEGKTIGNVTREQRLMMLRVLLAERFKLALHHSPENLAIYALEGGKTLRLRPLKDEEVACWSGCSDGPRIPLNHMRQKDVASLAEFLTRLGSDRPVVDKTGVKGNVAIDLDVSRIFAPAQRNGEPPTTADMFEAMASAIDSELGLKLVPTKAQVDVLVIDHAEKPTPD
jgi:uncharacterized protein (TIGR03435 family)